MIITKQQSSPQEQKKVKQLDFVTWSYHENVSRVKDLTISGHLAIENIGRL